MKIDKEEYRTTYIGGSRNFLLIKYADSKKEYPYMVYIDYEMHEVVRTHQPTRGHVRRDC